MSDYIAKADRLYYEGRFPRAREHYLAALERQPENKEILGKLARIALWENDTEQALDYWQRVYEQTDGLRRRWPLVSPLAYDMGSVRHRKGEFAEAAKWYRRSAGPWAVGPLKTVRAMQHQMEAFGDTVPYRISGERTVLPFVMLDPLPVVEVRINGRGPYNFFIDTGGADTILAPDLVEDMGLEVYGEFTGSFAAGKEAEVGLSSLKSLELAGITVENLPIHVLALEGIDELFGRRIDGVIGTSLLRRFHATIDYADLRLILRQPGQASRAELDAMSSRGIAIPFWLVQQHMMMARGHVNDLPDTLFFVDTGLAEHGFLISSATREAAAIEVDWSRAEEGMGGGGAIKSVQFTLDRITLGEGEASIAREDVSTVIHEEDISAFTGTLGFEVGGLISHGFFRDTSLTMDFEGMRLILVSQ